MSLPRSIPSLQRVWLVWGAVLAVLTLLPGMVHLFLTYQQQQEAMQENAAIMRRHFEQLIAARPTLWEFEQHRLEHVLTFRKAVNHERMVIFSGLGDALVTAGSDLTGPLIRVREPLHDGARVVGWLEVQREVLALLPSMGVTALLSLFLGAVVYGAAVRLPMRVVRHVTEQLSDERDQEVRLRRQAEARLQQAKRLEAVGTLAGGMAHSLNNILMPITLLGGNLRDKSPPGSRERESLTRICDAADRAKTLVANVLTVGRQGHLQMQPVKLQDLVRQVVHLAQQTLPPHIRLETDLPLRPLWTQVDPTQTIEAILNLTGNGVDALGDAVENSQALLRLELRPMVFGADQVRPHGLGDGDYACLTVADNGSGMSHDIVQRAPEPFFTTKDVGKGTGLGLYTVYTLMHTMGGDLQIDSEPGQGTRIHLYFPLISPNSSTES